jgi:hypothetical protein
MPSNYKDSKLIIKRLRELHSQNKLSQISEKLLFSETRPEEEFYLYRNDVWQVNNLADDPIHALVIKKHRAMLKTWMLKTKDLGPEPLNVYEMETADQMKSIRNVASKEAFRKNSELYKQWSREGK